MRPEFSGMLIITILSRNFHIDALHSTYDERPLKESEPHAQLPVSETVGGKVYVKRI